MLLSGLFVPLITPFDSSGDVDAATLEALATQVLADGATGLVALGTTGEPSSLSDSEKRAVVEVASRACAAFGAPLIVGAGDPAGATAAMTVVPPFVRPGEAGVVAYFAHLAGSSPVPLIVYNVPHRTGQHLSASALRDLAAIAGIIGFKHSPGGIDATTIDLLADPPPGAAILGGDDVFISPLLSLGAHGGILASAHLATAAFARLVTAWQTGDLGTARDLGHRLSRLSAALFAEPNPTVIKAVLHATGRIKTPHVRLPLLPASESASDQGLAALQTVKGPAG